MALEIVILVMMVNCSDIDYNQWENIFPNSEVVCFGIDNTNHSPQDIHNFLTTYLIPNQNYLVVVRYNQVNWTVRFYNEMANEIREGIAIFSDKGSIAYSNWYEHDKVTSVAFAQHEIREIKCKCDIKGNNWQSYLKQTSAPSDAIVTMRYVLVAYDSCNKENEEYLNAYNVALVGLNYTRKYGINAEMTFNCVNSPLSTTDFVFQQAGSNDMIILMYSCLSYPHECSSEVLHLFRMLPQKVKGYEFGLVHLDKKPYWTEFVYWMPITQKDAEKHGHPGMKTATKSTENTLTLSHELNHIILYTAGYDWDYQEWFTHDYSTALPLEKVFIGEKWYQTKAHCPPNLCPKVYHK